MEKCRNQIPVIPFPPARAWIRRLLEVIGILAPLALFLGLLLGSGTNTTRATHALAGLPISDGDQESCNEPGNLAPNPGFECPGASAEEALDWERVPYRGKPALLYRTQMTSRSGDWSVAIDSGSPVSAARWQTIPIQAHEGRLYEFSVWVSADRLSNIATVSLTFWSDLPNPHTLLWEAVHPEGRGDSAGKWVRLAHTYMAPAGTRYIRLECHLFGAGMVYLDDASIREGFMGLRQVDSPATVHPGDNLSYLLTFTNAGTITATNVVITNTFDPRVTLDAAVPAPDGGSGGMRYWTFPSLLAGASSQIVLTTTVKPDLPNGISLYNQVELGCDQMATISNTEDTLVESLAELTIVKTDSHDPVEAGDYLTYTIVYTNNGTLTMTGVVLNEFYPLYTQFVSANPSPSNPPENTLWLMPDLPPGESQSVIVVLSTSESATGQVLNYILVDSDQTDPQAHSESTTFMGSPPRFQMQLIPEYRSIPTEPEHAITQPWYLGNTGRDPILHIHVERSVLQDWKGHVRLEPEQIDSLEPGEWLEVSLTVEPATDEISGTYTVQLTATANEASAEATAVLVVEQLAGVETEPDYLRYAHPGDMITFTHWITNLGNAADTFLVQVQPSLPWPTSPLSVTLRDVGIGQVRQIPVTIQVPQQAQVGIENRVIVSATSITGQAYDFAVDVIILGPWDVYLPLVQRPYVSPDPFCNGDFADPLAPCWTVTTNPPVERICTSGACFARLGKAEYDASCQGGLTPGIAILAQTFTPAVTGRATLSFEYEIHTQDVLSELYDSLNVYANTVEIYAVTEPNPDYGCDREPMVVRGQAQVPISATMGVPIALEFRLINGDTWFNTYADIRNVRITY